jgi:hypothetical protein
MLVDQHVMDEIKTYSQDGGFHQGREVETFSVEPQVGG